MIKGDWVSYTFRDGRGTLRNLTGKVTSTRSNSVTFRSDGGQPGYPRGKSVTVPAAELRLSDSPHAPHRKRNPTLGSKFIRARVRRRPGGGVEIQIPRRRR